MAQKNNETIVLVASLAVTVGLLGAGYWFVRGRDGGDSIVVESSDPTEPTTSEPSSNSNNNQSNGDAPASASLASIEATLPNPNLLQIDGSTTMVALMQNLNNAYAQANPSIPAIYGQPANNPNGSSGGIRNLINGTVDLAASSRPLKPEEATANLQVVAIAKDAVAVVVSASNPYRGGLTMSQLRQIYEGRITNWSEVGGPNVPIKVINRAQASGTRDLFQNVVLLSQSFAPDSANFITWPQDETTAIIRELGNNGISYATVSQVANQSTVRIMPIDDSLPTDINAIRNNTYPISRNIFLITTKQTSPAVKEFIELALSPQGQQLATNNGFIPIN
ncbi:phosphate ABC transporter substrate-binding protein, PhoT family [Thalassoporum mexicanum PCC 7367]|uniref:phosphate ABC transporter substrate-binding protein n=1 Tax=Thalassoporum mexicanum TaxID=3457544 RepID=UPI00029FD2AA|nr:phosphate ABC transporter substrate-binding protein [Pseudanabaena sp. PCC 7367]AFY70709.1 phosphate ABC transporter substrate-binding protein, PhoT family [Pseudanabaena sp. PCC 7367]